VCKEIVCPVHSVKMKCESLSVLSNESKIIVLSERLNGDSVYCKTGLEVNECYRIKYLCDFGCEFISNDINKIKIDSNEWGKRVKLIKE